MKKKAPTVCSLLAAAFLTGCFVDSSAPPGPPGISDYEVVVGETPVTSDVQKQLEVDCPAGKKALGAGWGVLDPTSAILEAEPHTSSQLSMALAGWRTRRTTALSLPTGNYGCG